MSSRGVTRWTEPTLDAELALLGDSARLRRHLLMELAVLAVLLSCAVTFACHDLDVGPFSLTTTAIIALTLWGLCAVGVRAAIPRVSFGAGALLGGLWGGWLFSLFSARPGHDSPALCGLIPIGLLAGMAAGGVAALVADAALGALRRRSLVSWSLLRVTCLMAVALCASAFATTAPPVVRCVVPAIVAWIVARRALLLLALRRVRDGRHATLRVGDADTGAAESVPVLDALPWNATLPVLAGPSREATPFRDGAMAAVVVARVGRRSLVGVGVLLAEWLALLATVAAARGL